MKIKDTVYYVGLNVTDNGEYYEIHETKVKSINDSFTNAYEIKLSPPYLGWESHFIKYFYETKTIFEKSFFINKTDAIVYCQTQNNILLDELDKRKELIIKQLKTLHFNE